MPTASVLLGQGTGGAALAMFPADLRVGATDAWLSPLPPEGASIIMRGDTDHAPQMARDQQIWARELFEAGIIDVLTETLDDVVAALDAWASADPTPDPGGRIRVGR